LKCRCEKCQPGSPSKTYAQSWRVETEARLLLTWPLAQRREYLNALPDRRRLPLEAELMRQWLSRKGGS
jgi:hypothetical protein